MCSYYLNLRCSTKSPLFRKKKYLHITLLMMMMLVMWLKKEFAIPSSFDQFLASTYARLGADVCVWYSIENPLCYGWSRLDCAKPQIGLIINIVNIDYSQNLIWSMSNLRGARYAHIIIPHAHMRSTIDHEWVNGGGRHSAIHDHLASNDICFKLIYNTTSLKWFASSYVCVCDAISLNIWSWWIALAHAITPFKR